ncbi:MAG TPA: protein-glutamate O-methyltransferase CheR [Planctomycetota bacterium]|jgi:chemotaxis protein methyltransferase CheR
MEQKTFEQFRRIVYEHSGIALGENKQALVAARIGKRMRQLGIGTHADYLKYVTADGQQDEVVHLLDVISTNVTSFFREPAHFDFVRAAVSRWLAQGQRRFRFWSTACATGEEPYSLAMVLAETMRGYEVDCRILATDISTGALRKCRAGTYPVEKLEHVPQSALRHWFKLSREGEQTVATVSPLLQKMIVFTRLNLSQPPFPMKGPFDLVLCRNVMIYFNNAGRRRLLDEIYRTVRTDGYLLVGHAESLTGLVSSFKAIRPSIYTKR